MIDLTSAHSDLVCRVHHHSVYVKVVVSSHCGFPLKTDLHASSDYLGLDYAQPVYVHEADFQVLGVVYRVVVGVTQLNVVSARLSCPGEILLALIIYHIHQVLDVFAIFWAWLEGLLSGQLAGLPEVLVRCAVKSFLYQDWLLLEDFQFHVLDAVEVHIAIRTDHQIDRRVTHAVRVDIASKVNNVVS
jgi:hypothetical protein